MITQAYCPHCEDYTAHEVTGAGHMAHFLMTIVTLGLWFPIWVLRALTARKLNCRTCGRRKGMLG